MTAALIASNIAWAAALVFVVSRGLSFYERSVSLADARLQNHREHVKHLEDQIVLLKVEPKTAAVVAATGSIEPDDIGPLTDEELAELELERIEARR